MSRAYSNKALPAGTVLREWRLEEVLGVGGFGIVYKARGIYFNELVAIKEYFPSSISERDSVDTVVPIDSDAEEVHALGLKKFVEEAKLLWNLSTPSRHPNIVSVRSLFEIHGTAYMVMDFEDGMSLSSMLKQGRRFNERSLWNVLRPVAEGLDRAHRVGVLHRDIKPPNILINEDNRPVLIDFGSARFDTAEATSTTVTFHTPPYAAIEQYVKTYEQGPWTDVYALGVVMYECITGEKPPEVLERLHGGLGTPLAGGKWPGYSKKFLAAIDSAMTVKPDERPQSIASWLEQFGKKPGGSLAASDSDEDATRFYVQQVTTDEIKPVAVDEAAAAVPTDVPTDPKQAQFKRVGQDTDVGKKTADAASAAATAAAGTVAASAAAGASDADTSAAGAASAQTAVPSDAAAEGALDRSQGRGAPGKNADDDAKDTAKKRSPALLVGAAVAVLLAGGAGALMLAGGSGDDAPAAAVSEADNGIMAATAAGPANTMDDANLSADALAVANEAATTAQAEEADAAGQEALRREAARATAAEARLAALQKAQPKAPSTPSKSTATAAAKGRNSTTAAASSADTSKSEAGVSQAKLAQFHSTVDEARNMARQVIRSGTRENAQLARNYDSYLKTLKDSMRGIKSDREADALIKQASQTRAYIKFLQTQPKK